MSRHMLTLAAAVIFSGLIGGCRSLSPPGASLPADDGTARMPAGYPDHTLEEVLSRLPDMPAEFQEIAAEASVHVASPEESGRFTARIAWRRADSMLVRVRFPLGIEGARVLITPDSAYVWDRIEKTLIVGTPTSIEAVLPVAVAGTDLVALATGFIRPGGSAVGDGAGRDGGTLDPAAWSLRADSLHYELSRKDGSERLLVDPARWRVVYAEYRNSDGRIREQRWYAAFAEMGGYLVPRRVSVSQPLEDTRILMSLSRFNTQPDRLSFDLGAENIKERFDIE
ncbi:MAG: hypothetical protein COV99_09660 [Bacteroidetes bacterium CG12_big_fil_rev_8_21_14_0_65_60_17]|nr:MAG: hypothetical protein COV99_09660 [Bacteroidetes bacterium CG12_big_fil_rev_8_21_14_0_65_60_17]